MFTMLIFIVMTCLKVLLIPSYRSTDFEVHRNWLAVTHSLPIGRWYVDETSQWTLDYPPLFAWFEWMLSQLARNFDPEMLSVTNLNYCSPLTVLFQRLSVIVGDILLYVGLHMCISAGAATTASSSSSSQVVTRRLAVCVLVAACPALLLVDHIHFQYNGLLLGLLLISVALMNQGRHLLSAFVFTVLLNMKHIFLYVAPAYFIYLLRCHCFGAPAHNRSALWRTLSQLRVHATLALAAVVVGVFAVSFGPFIVLGQVPQVLSRLFPFKRGLCHAYWAPNVWALYIALDRVLLLAVRLMSTYSPSGYQQLRQLQLVAAVPPTAAAAFTGGLVEDVQPAVLPAITPALTMALTLIAQLPALCALWRQAAKPTGSGGDLARCIARCALSAFLFGWHVHEKALLLALLPLAVACVGAAVAPPVSSAAAAAAERHWRLCCHLAGITCVSMMPLLPVASYYTVFKLLSLTAYGLALALCSPQRRPGGSTVGTLYWCLLGAVCVYSELVHALCPWRQRWPFLPLLLVSVTCAVGVVYVWLGLCWETVMERQTQADRQAGKQRQDKMAAQPSCTTSQSATKHTFCLIMTKLFGE